MKFHDFGIFNVQTTCLLMNINMMYWTDPIHAGFGKPRQLALPLEVAKDCTDDAPTIKQLHWMERQHFRGWINSYHHCLSPALPCAKSYMSALLPPNSAFHFWVEICLFSLYKDLNLKRLDKALRCITRDKHWWSGDARKLIREYIWF